jgi:hypothetical protein
VADKSLPDLIRIYFKAYETKDRSALESTFSDNFTFTSPHDDHIDRATSWNVAGPTASTPGRSTYDRGHEAFVLYDLEPDNGQPFRNTEFFTGSGGKIKTIEVYFGSKIGRVEDIK